MLKVSDSEQNNLMAVKCPAGIAALFPNKTP